MIPSIREGGRGRALSVLGLALLVSLGSAGSADTFRLADGKLVRGELLKERADSFVVDLGFQVVVIPRNLVEEHLPDDQRAPLAAPPVGAPSVAVPAPERPSAAGSPSARPAAAGARVPSPTLTLPSPIGRG